MFLHFSCSPVDWALCTCGNGQETLQDASPDRGDALKKKSHQKIIFLSRRNKIFLKVYLKQNLKKNGKINFFKNENFRFFQKWKILDFSKMKIFDFFKKKLFREKNVGYIFQKQFGGANSETHKKTYNLHNMKGIYDCWGVMVISQKARTAIAIWSLPPPYDLCRLDKVWKPRK